MKIKSQEVQIPQTQGRMEADRNVQFIKPPIVSLDDASEVLMEYLPTETQALIREASAGMVLPLWQMLLGYVMSSRDRSEIWAPHILSMWEAGIPASAPRPCRTCGKMFTSEFPNAQYCCNPCAFEKLATIGHAEDCPAIRYERIATA